MEGEASGWRIGNKAWPGAQIRRDAEEELGLRGTLAMMALGQVRTVEAQTRSWPRVKAD